MDGYMRDWWVGSLIGGLERQRDDWKSRRINKWSDRYIDGWTDEWIVDG